MLATITQTNYGSTQLTFIAGLLPARVPPRPIDPNAGLVNYPPLHLHGEGMISIEPIGPTLLQEVIALPSQQIRACPLPLALMPGVKRSPRATWAEGMLSTPVRPPISTTIVTDVIDVRAAEVIVERIADTAPISPMADEAPRARTQTLDGVTNGAAAHDSPSIISPSIISYDNPRLTSLPPLALEHFKLAAQRALDHALSYLLNEETLTDLKTNVSAMTLALQVLKGERPKGKTPLAGWDPAESEYGQSLKVSRMVRLLRVCVEATIVEAQVACQLGSYVYTDADCRYVFREWYGGDALIVQARTAAGYTQGRMAFTRAEVEAARVAERDEMREARASAERNRSPFAKGGASRAQDRIDGLNGDLFQGMKNSLMGKVTSNA